MKNVLVTGGAGFVGSHVVDKLLSKDYRVIALDNFDSFYERAVKENNIKQHRSSDHYQFLEEDIRNYEQIKSKVKENIDVIIHLAAKAGVRPSVKDPIAFQQVNVIGTQQLLELAKEWDVKQFVFSSSSSVYGSNENVPWSEDDNVLKPISPYASTKISAELLGHVYSQLYDIRFLALRLFTVYGPRQRPDLAIHKFLRLMDEGKEITLYGDGSSRRDYTYVSDIVQGIAAAVEYDESDYEIINLGNNRTVSLLTLVETLEEAAGITAKKTFGPEQPGDVKQTWADIQKAQSLLGYQPQVGLKEGLENFVKWYYDRG